MSTSPWIKCALGASLLGLAACSGGGGDGGDAPTPPTPVAIENSFGSTFSTAFAAEENAAAGPIDPQPGDLPAVSPTSDPTDF